MIKNILLLTIFLLTSCSKLNLIYQKQAMQDDITENRRELYQESYGQIDDPEREIE